MSDDIMNPAPIAKKTMVLFFLIDTSGSMAGEKIQTVNEAIIEVIPMIRDISNDNADADIKFAVQTFDSDVNWVTPSPVDLNTYKYQDLSANGGTSMGVAFSELASKLDKKAFLSNQVGNYAPAIILLSDGVPTDDYKAGLNALKQNKYFGQCIKVAFAIGKDADVRLLEEFTGNSELVIQVNNKQLLKSFIKFVTLKSSEVGSKSKGTPEDKQQQVAQAINTEKGNIIAADPEANVSGGW